MKKRGFTLIELLAVIVILAIIALIAVPIVLNMIENARKSAAKSSALGYIDAINYNNELADAKADIEGLNNYTMIEDGTHNVTTINSNLKLKGEMPIKGTVKIENGIVTDADIVIGGYFVSYIEKIAIVGTKYAPRTFTIAFKNGDTTVDTKIVMEGEEIGSLPAGPEVSGKVFKGWYTALENGTKVSTDSVVNYDIQTYYAIYEDPKTCNDFSNDSWSTIVQNVYPVGCEKEVAIDMDNNGSSESYTVRLANNTSPSVCNTSGYSKTACGTVIEFVDLVGTYNINTTKTTSGGWKSTAMVTYLNDTFYNKLPNDLKSVIIETYPIVSGSGINESPNITEEDTIKNKIYLLSAREVGFDWMFDDKRNVTTDTRTLDYYSANNNNSARIKKNLSNNEQTWWLRTAASGDSDYFLNVIASGDIGNNNANYTYGVAPAFRIG